MIKKTICLILSLAGVLCSNFTLITALAAEKDDVGIGAPSAILIDFSTKKSLYEKKPHEKRPCASLTKIMTMCLAFDAIESGKLNYDTPVPTSPIAASQSGSDIWLVEGETLTVDDLLKAVALVSANDACVSLAEAVGGTKESFVSMMNEKAKALGMNDTTFKNCTGDDEDGHVTSAYDVSLMSGELMKHEKALEYTSVWLDYIRDGATQLVNTNSLVKNNSGITGLKTGTSTMSGACISACAERNGMTLIAVVLGDKTGEQRFSDAQRLLDYGFSSFASFLPVLPEDLPKTVDITGGMQQNVAVNCTPDGEFLIKSGSEGDVTSSFSVYDNIEAPVKKGQKLGSVIYKKGEETLGEYPLTAAEDIEKINVWGIFVKLCRLVIMEN